MAFNPKAYIRHKLYVRYLTSTHNFTQCFLVFIHNVTNAFELLYTVVNSIGPL